MKLITGSVLIRWKEDLNNPLIRDTKQKPISKSIKKVRNQQKYYCCLVWRF